MPGTNLSEDLSRMLQHLTTKKEEYEAFKNATERFSLEYKLLKNTVKRINLFYTEIEELKYGLDFIHHLDSREIWNLYAKAIDLLEKEHWF